MPCYIILEPIASNVFRIASIAITEEQKEWWLTNARGYIAIPRTSPRLNSAPSIVPAGPY